MDQHTNPYLTERARELLRITEGCRPDMHEPDEQDLSATVIGDHLDNTMGEYVNARAIEQGYQEYVVVLRRRLPTGMRTEYSRINLATLIALARVGSETVLGFKIE